jgi:hypothetical protein
MLEFKSLKRVDDCACGALRENLSIFLCVVVQRFCRKNLKKNLFIYTNIQHNQTTQNTYTHTQKDDRKERSTFNFYFQLVLNSFFFFLLLFLRQINLC